MAKSIFREPGAAQPWPPASLRPAPPRSNSTTLADLVAPEPSGTKLPPSGHPAALDRLEPATFVENARQEAERLLQQARDEACQLRAAAVQEGYTDGQARGLEEWAEERQRVRELLGGIAGAYREFCLRQADDLAALATAAAEKLLGEQLALEPERVLAIVRQALEEMAGSAPLSVHLNPADIEAVRVELMADPRRAATLQLSPDPTIERGGCWIAGEHGEVDATVSGRLARLRQGMRNEE